MCKTYLSNNCIILLSLLSVTYSCNAEHIINHSKAQSPFSINLKKEEPKPNYNTNSSNTQLSLHEWLSYALPQVNSIIIKKDNELLSDIELNPNIKNGKQEIKEAIVNLKISEGSWTLSSFLNMDIYRY
ncbi:hypothetical protein MHO82_09925 [Vibrio sp. Of7-15]|uniref:hypothetical protein n=1 Tax=Vibrio sp. Of7-15 TaxID=2724879 RepID=UPI001EF1727F|nr:hypothetical protein [Vibrio sp. Of7-15]MCG7497185.1 hypothetical protein [Vibrio sp. Of7-15]